MKVGSVDLLEHVLRSIYIESIDFLCFLLPPQPHTVISSINYRLKQYCIMIPVIINGLIFGKALFNPLTRGAHCYGGSTHKTLPGPHKGFLAMNELSIAKRIGNKADHFVSHHHTSSTLSLAITLLEMKWCQGQDYANQVIINTKAFAHALNKNGFVVAAKERSYTECHQTWMHLPLKDSQSFYEKLTQLGIMVSQFDELPGIPQPAFRLSFAELTKMGATVDDAELLAKIMLDILQEPQAIQQIKDSIKSLRKKLSSTKFCFNLEDLDESILTESFGNICKMLFE